MELLVKGCRQHFLWEVKRELEQNHVFSQSLNEFNCHQLEVRIETVTAKDRSGEVGG